MYNNYHVFKYDNKNFIFSKTFLDFDEINDEEYNWLKKHENNLETHNVDNHISLSDMNSYFTNKKIKLLDQNVFTTGYFSFTPSHKCNLRCKYCFANGGDNYLDKKKNFEPKDIDQICKFMMYEFLPDANSFKLDFASGGEPLLNKEFLYESLVRIKKSFEKNSKDLTIWLCTNGTCKDIDIIQKLSLIDVQIGVSLDGAENIQNETRVYKNGRGTYQDVLKFVNDIQCSPNIRTAFHFRL